MIDFKKIKQQPAWKTIFKELAGNAIQLLFILYGLKCILTLHGRMPVIVMGTVYHSVRMMPVAGLISVTIGLSYFCGGLFLDLSYGNPPDESRTRFWRIGRFASRWGSLFLMVIFWREANLLRLNSNEKLFSFFPSFATSGDKMAILLISVALAIILVIWFLGAMYYREQVKKDLWGRMCKPLHIWWRPFAYWTPIYWYISPAGFRVVYSDNAGYIHKAYCYTHGVYVGSAFQSPKIKWLKDEIAGQLPLPEVWASDEIIRPKLSQMNTPDDESNENSGIHTD